MSEIEKLAAEVQTAVDAVEASRARVHNARSELGTAAKELEDNLATYRAKKRKLEQALPALSSAANLANAARKDLKGGTE